jgi:plastocyanin
MGNIVQTEANNILGASVAGNTYTACTKPVKLALITNTTAPTNTTIGSEVSGGSYARQDTTTSSVWGAPSGGTITNSAGAVSFTGMPACTIASIELWDSYTRSVSDGVTNSTTTITSATAAFTAEDVGRAISGSTDIPAGTIIASVTNSTTAVLSQAATGSHSSQTFNIGPTRRWFGALTASKTVNAGDTVTFASSSISITLS